MRSTADALKNRGFLSNAEYESMVDAISDHLEDNLQNAKAVVRTAVIRKIRADNRFEYTNHLCELLKTEKKLYTRIALCECLAAFGDHSLKALVPLIGRIGNNQHKRVANVDLGKKSYPLPRDIVARVIIRMGPMAFPSLEKAMESDDNPALSEIIDIIGHIAYHAGDYRLEDRLVRLYDRNRDELIAWKLIRAFGAFPSKTAQTILEGVRNDLAKRTELRIEAQRSLSRIQQRNSTACHATGPEMRRPGIVD